MKRKYNVNTEHGEIQVYLDGSIMLNDGKARNILGEIVPEEHASKHSLRRTCIGALDPEDFARIEAVVQREIEAIIAESIENII